MRGTRREVVVWVGRNIVPHEASLRARLRSMGVQETEISDLVQDAYLAIAQLDTVAHIRNPRAYFFAAARSALLQRVRRERIVRIDSLTDADALALASDAPDPERHASARLELERVGALLAALPERCRDIFMLRRIQGVPQREIARGMGVSEEIVEAQAARALRLLMKAIAAGGGGETRAAGASNGRTHDAKRRH